MGEMLPIAALQVHVKSGIIFRVRNISVGRHGRRRVLTGNILLSDKEFQSLLGSRGAEGKVPRCSDVGKCMIG